MTGKRSAIQQRRPISGPLRYGDLKLLSPLWLSEFGPFRRGHFSRIYCPLVQLPCCRSRPKVLSRYGSRPEHTNERRVLDTSAMKVGRVGRS
jgi:hypothetical protein